MIGIFVEGRLALHRLRRHEPAAPRGGIGHRPVLDRRGIAQPVELQPVMVRRDALDRIAIIAKAIEMDIARLAPVAEFDPQLERPVGFRDEILLVDPEHAVELGDQRHRRLAHPDRSDLVGFDQHDLCGGRFEHVHEERGRHPSGGAPAGDHDLANGLRSHPTSLREPGKKAPPDRSPGAGSRGG